MKCTPVVARDDDCASAGTLALLDEVAFRETFTTVGGLELLCELVITNAASVDDRVGWKAVLNNS
jgi:hypothetical protein